MKNLLIVVDYQNDFVTGSLGFPQAQQLEPALAQKIREYRTRGDEILFTLDTHDATYPDTQEGKNLPIMHTIRDSWGWQLAGAAASLCAPGDVCLEKPCFGAAGLLDYLRNRQYASVELAGVVSYLCVLSNVVIVKTALPETPVIVDARCVAGPDNTLHEKALDVMQGLQVQVKNR